jgi:hypothetical protein
METTVYEALGLTKDWTDHNTEELQAEMESNELVSSTMEASIKRIQIECFGEGDYGISDYEKKLIFTGFQMSQMENRISEAKKFAVLIKGMKSFSGKTRPGN